MRSSASEILNPENPGRIRYCGGLNTSEYLDIYIYIYIMYIYIYTCIHTYIHMYVHVRNTYPLVSEPLKHERALQTPKKPTLSLSLEEKWSTALTILEEGAGASVFTL